MCAGGASLRSQAKWLDGFSETPLRILPPRGRILLFPFFSIMWLLLAPALLSSSFPYIYILYVPFHLYSFSFLGFAILS